MSERRGSALSIARLSTEPVPPRLRHWFADALPGFEGDFTLSRIGNGQSCLTYVVRSLEWSVVLRRPPLGAHPRGAFDVGREFRVMRALADRPLEVPVPRLHAFCSNKSVIGAPFYIMEYIDGAVLRDVIPAGTTAGDLTILSEQFIRRLTCIHSISVSQAGLFDLAPQAGYLNRQLTRLQSQWERVRRREIRELDTLGDWLRGNIPEQLNTTLIHGDYKLDNVVVGLPETPSIKAILDWELSTLGDPLADLGWLLYFWREAGEETFAIPVCSVTDRSGFPTRVELADEYARSTGRRLTAIRWYIALAGWKIAIIMETSYQRYCDGITDHPAFARLDVGVPHMARRALELMSAWM